MKITLLLLLKTGQDIYVATSILLPSIIKYFNLEHIEEIIIIIKNNEEKLLNLRLKELNNKMNYQLKINIIKETKILNMLNIPKNTYYLQMYIKLLCHKIVKTTHYLTLDADVLFINNTSINDYLKITDEKNIKSHFYKIKKIDIWMKRSMEYLEFNNKPDYCINQTPFVLNKNLVEKMFTNINVREAILDKQCSEYTLYHVYLLKNNLFDQYYEFNRFANFPITFPFNMLSNEKINKYLLILKKQKYPVTIIQSRINVHKRLNDTIKTVVPNSYYNKKNIAVLTCISNDKYYKRYRNAIEIKKNYCKYHNYQFILYKLDDTYKHDLKKGWMKIYKLLDIIKKYDYVFTSDADVIITNRDIRIEDIIFEFMKEKHNLLITTDFNSINSGNIIWKNCKKTIILLNEIIKIGNNKIRYSIKKPFIPKGIYEQPTLIYLINKYIDTFESAKIIPQFIMNSYCAISYNLRKPNIIPMINNYKNRTNWKNDDFLVHLAGLNYFNNDGNFKFNIDRMIDRFVKRYYLNISIKEGNDYMKIK